MRLIDDIIMSRSTGLDYESPLKEELSFNRHIIGVGVNNPWQFYFIFSDQSQSEIRKTGVFKELLLCPTDSKIKRILIQSTTKDELRGLEFRDKAGKVLL